MTNDASKRTSPRFIKQILTDSRITAKWKNCGSWQKEEWENLKDAADHCNIKIVSKADGLIRLSAKFGRMSVTENCSFGDFEHEVVKMVEIYLLYLGDKATLCSRFGTSKVNF